MKSHQERVIGQMAARLLSLPLEDYLVSENFLQFCRQHELEDAWQEALRRSRDRPDLYGKSVTKNAFELFLLHMVHNRPGEFPDLFSGFLTGFSQATCRPLPLDDLKKDLAELGCDTGCPVSQQVPGSRTESPKRTAPEEKPSAAESPVERPD